MSDVFLSYSRKDKVFVERLHAALVAARRDSWVDWEDILPTAEWFAEIELAIRAADTVIFVLSPAFTASEHCAQELALAARNNKRLVPIVWRDVPSETVAPPLARLNWLFFRTNDDFDNAFQRLIEALDTDLGWVRTHTRLLQRAAEWDGASRSDVFVLHGADLHSAEQWLAQSAGGKEPRPTPLQAEYIYASRRCATRQQRTVLTATLIGLVVTTALALTALLQANEATRQKRVANTAEAVARNTGATAVAERNIAQARELAARSISNLFSDRELALLLAIASVQTNATFESQDALRQALRAHYRRTDLNPRDDPARRATFSPDGKVVLVVGEGGLVRTYDAISGEAIARLGRSPTDSPPWVALPVFAPDSSSVIVPGDDDVLRIVAATTGTQIAAFRDFPAADVDDAALSPDGRWILTNTGGGEIQLWAAEPLDQVSSLRGERAYFNPTSRWVWIAGERESALWDLERRQTTATLSGVVGWMFSARGVRVLQVDADDHARIVEVDSGVTISTLARTMHAQDIAAFFNPTGSWVAILRPYTSSGDAELWDVASGNPISLLPGHSNTGIGSSRSGGVKRVLFSEGGARAVTVNGDKTVELWNPISAQQIASFSDVDAVSLSADGTSLLTDSRLWDAITGERIHAFPYGEASFSPTGDKIVTQSEGTVSVWETGIEVAILRGHRGAITHAGFSNDGRWMFTGGADGSIRVWEAPSGRAVVSLHDENRVIHAAVLTADKARIAVASAGYAQTGGRVRVWDYRADKVLAQALIDSYGACDVASAPDGKWIAYTTYYGPGYVIEADTGKQVAEIPDRCGLVSFAADSHRLLIGTAVWNVPTGKKLYDLDEGTYRLSPDSALLLNVSEDGIVSLRDFASGGRLYQLAKRTRSGIAVFSPDGRRIGTVGSDAITVWDAADGIEKNVIHGVTHGVYRISFGPDGTLMLGVADDNTVRIWDIQTGVELAVLRGHTQTLSEALFSPDGRYVLTASADGTARLYAVQLADLLALATSRVTRELSCAERNTYLHETVACPTATASLNPAVPAPPPTSDPIAAP